MLKVLDARQCLYGEQRLSDAQVVALRAAAAGPIRYVDGVGWRTHTAEPVSLSTLRALNHMGYLQFEVNEDQHRHRPETAARIIERGRKVLSQIDEASGRAERFA